MNSKALYDLSYGMYLVTSQKGRLLNGQVANTVFQITSEPPAVAVSINRQNLTWEYINVSGVFAVSVLSQDTPLPFIADFGFRSGRDGDKLAGLSYRLGQTGAPLVLNNATAWLEARTVNSIDIGTHTIFVGQIVDADVIDDKPVMTYDYYRQVKRGTTPKAAPSFVADKETVKPSMIKYKCTVCGWVYDPESGDPDSGIVPGTPFEMIPDNWRCPVCVAAKGEFEKMDY